MKVNPLAIVPVFALLLLPLSRAQQATGGTPVRDISKNSSPLNNPPPEALNDPRPHGTAGDDATDEQIRLGNPVDAPNPIVPRSLQGKIGAAVLGATLRMDGTFADLAALGGDQDLDEAALDAVHEWRYTPATQNGKPVEASVFIVFRLRKGKIARSIEPDLPYPTKPRTPIEEQRARGELFLLVDRTHIKPPKALYQPEPDYSEPARAANYQGTAVLGVIVGRDGTPIDVWVVRKLGLGLDQKALLTVRRWKFAPARKDGEPVPVLANIEVDFHLY